MGDITDLRGAVYLSIITRFRSSFPLSQSLDVVWDAHHNQMVFIPGMQGKFDIQKSINGIYYNHNLIKKNHMSISIHAKKAFNKIQYPLMINSQ